jgi:hypothetical protein
MKMFKSVMAAAAFVATILCPPLGQAAQYSLGTPFPIACEGILGSRNGIYFLDEDPDHPRSNLENDIICSNATIAEEKSKHALKYTLKEDAIIRLLRKCSLGKPCRIVGYVNGLSHDVYFFVKIDTISAKEPRWSSELVGGSWWRTFSWYIWGVTSHEKNHCTSLDRMHVVRLGNRPCIGI